VDNARLLVASLPYSGDWLHVPPVTAVGLTWLLDECVRVAVTHRLGCKACEPHTCVCGKAVDVHSLHGLSCHGRAIGSQPLNDIPWTAIERAQITSVKDPVNLMCEDSHQLSYHRPKGSRWLSVY